MNVVFMPKITILKLRGNFDYELLHKERLKINPVVHAATGTIYSAGGCMRKGVNFYEMSQY